MFDWLSYLLLMLPLSQAYVQPAAGNNPARLNIPLPYYELTCVTQPVLRWHDGDKWQQSARLPNKGGWIDGVARHEQCDLAICSRSPYTSIPLAHYQPSAQAYHFTSQAVDGVIEISLSAYQDAACTRPHPIRFRLDTRTLPRDPAFPPQRFRNLP